MDDRIWKKMTREEKLSYLNEEIQKSRAHWDDIYTNGCSDPFWPDGVNLNLVRNHIIYYLSQINDLNHGSVQLSLFGTVDGLLADLKSDSRIPEKVPDEYMACERRCAYFMASA